MAYQGGNVTLYVKDLDASVRFYSKVVGLAIQVHAPGHFALLSAGTGFHIGLHPIGPESPPPGQRGSIQVGLKVTGPIESAVGELQARGLSSFGPVWSDGPVRLAKFTDLDGHRLYLFEEPPSQPKSRPI